MPYKRGSLIDILNKIQPASIFSFSELNHNLNMISRQKLIQSRMLQIVSAILTAGHAVLLDRLLATSSSGVGWHSAKIHMYEVRYITVCVVNMNYIAPSPTVFTSTNKINAPNLYIPGYFPGKPGFATIVTYLRRWITRRGCVYSAYPLLLWWLWEYLYLI